MAESNEFIDTFRQEADELLVTVEESILDIEDNPDDADAINRLFRAVHTIKGSGSMFGFNELAGFTHHLETVLDRVRGGALQVDRGLIDLVLTSRDLIKGMLAGEPEAPCEDPARLTATIAGLQGLGSADKTEIREAPKAKPAGMRVVVVRFKPGEDTFTSGMDPAFVLQELAELGECQIVCDESDLPDLAALDPMKCHLKWSVAIYTEADDQAIRDVFVFVEDTSEIEIQELPPVVELDEDEPVPKLGELLVRRESLDRETLEEALAERPLLGEQLVEAGAVTKEAVATALVEQAGLAKKKAAGDTDSVRVPSVKLDTLINLIGELVITQAQLSQVAGSVGSYELNTPVEEIERLVSELRDLVLSVRMMPIGTTFNRFRRLVRDLSSELGKEIELVTEGGDTELDKGVIDRLADPLVHLIRNCVDHGIEAPTERAEHGKSPKGKIRLAAAHRGTNVVISVQDDGKGLDADAIRRKAVEKGLIGHDTQLSNKDTYALVMKPGFSTARQVTSVSGRGVGMDVVKREIDALRGSIEIDSVQDAGTEIVLSLPLTLAIIEGLLVEVGGSEFVIPLSAIEECLELTAESFALGSGRDIVQVRGEPLPCVFLRDFFAVDERRPTLEEAVVVRVGSHRIAIVVDHVIGDHQTVIKSLGKAYRDVVGVSGATILGDGTVALILDVDAIVRAAEQEEARALGRAA